MSDSSSSQDPKQQMTRVFSRTPSSWDPQDDLLLRHLKEEQKLGWKEIASHFAHRTPNACQFRWRRLRSGSLKGNEKTEKSTSAANTDDGRSTGSSTPGTSASIPKSVSVATSLQSGEVGSSTNIGNGASYNKFQSIPPQIKSNTLSSGAKINNKFSFTSSTNDPQNVSNGTTKRRLSSKIEPRDTTVSIPYSSPSSASSSDDEIIDAKPRSVSVSYQTNLHPTASYSGTPLSSVSSSNIQWTKEEDELIIIRNQRQLNLAELSILLPSRSESDINQRISQLEISSRRGSFKESPLKNANSYGLKKKNRSMSTSSPMYSTNTIISHPTTIPLLPQSSKKSRSRSFTHRSKSFSLLSSPYFTTTAPLTIQERFFNQRKNSISNTKSSIYASSLTKPRSNSMRYSNSLAAPLRRGSLHGSMSNTSGVYGSIGSISSMGNFSNGIDDGEEGVVEDVVDDSMTYSSDEEEFVSYNTSNIRGEPIVRNVSRNGGGSVAELINS